VQSSGLTYLEDVWAALGLKFQPVRFGLCPVTKAERNALLFLGGVFLFGLILAQSKNARVRKFGRTLERDAEEGALEEI
jgi:hypothetical protein